MPQNPEIYSTPPRVWSPHISPVKDLSFEAPTHIMPNPWMIMRQNSLYAASLGYTFCSEQCQLDSKKTQQNELSVQIYFLFHLYAWFSIQLCLSACQQSTWIVKVAEQLVTKKIISCLPS